MKLKYIAGLGILALGGLAVLSTSGRPATAGIGAGAGIPMITTFGAAASPTKKETAPTPVSYQVTVEAPKLGMAKVEKPKKVSRAWPTGGPGEIAPAPPPTPGLPPAPEVKKRPTPEAMAGAVSDITTILTPGWGLPVFMGKKLMQFAFTGRFW